MKETIFNKESNKYILVENRTTTFTTYSLFIELEGNRMPLITYTTYKDNKEDTIHKSALYRKGQIKAKKLLQISKPDFKYKCDHNLLDF